MGRANNAELPKDVLDKLTEIICVDIGSKILDGVTYVVVGNSQKEINKVQKYISVRRAIDNEGYAPNEIFRVHEICNGYIFDIDMTLVKTISTMLAKIASKNNPNVATLKELIAVRPDERRDKDMKLLAKKCLETYKSGQDTLEVALFNKNVTNKIIMAVESSAGERGIVNYNAYNIKHTDLEDVNIKYLVARGIRISSVEPCEIIGNNSGLRVILKLAQRVKKEI